MTSFVKMSGSGGGVKTRHDSQSKLSDYLGPGKALLGNELPTLRAILRQGLLFQEEKMLLKETKKKNYPVSELVKDMSKALSETWIKANSSFSPPVVVGELGIQKRLQTDWETLQKIVWNQKIKEAQVKEFEAKLDKLVNLTKCKCEIHTCVNLKCSENCDKCKAVRTVGRAACQECQVGAHITCTCPKEVKIPVLELLFMKMQQDKVGEKGAMRISDLVDSKEQKRYEKKEARKTQREDVLPAKREEKRQRVEEELKAREIAEESETNVSAFEVEEGEPPKSVSDFLQKRNTVDISGLASTAMRYQSSSREAAALATAFLGDLMKAGVLPPEAAYLAVDGAKVQRARENMMEMAKQRGEEKTQESDIQCVMFDSRIDKTKVQHYDKETDKFYPRLEAEDHYTLTDGEGRYLHHFTKQGKKQTESDDEIEDDSHDEESQETLSETQKDLQKKPAEVVADQILEWVRDHGVEDTLNLLAGDSTNSNTGRKAGVMAWLEKKLGRKYHWLICMLHTNELGLRALIEKYDGKTCSKTGFSGPLGKLLSQVKFMKPCYTFKKIEVGPEMINLSPQVVSELSTDQKNFYKRCLAAKTGILPREVALCKSGTIVHSRWLTTAETFLEMWESEHGLEGELLEKLETIVTYIVSVYGNMWFDIKVKHSWLEGPRHVLKELSLFRLQSKKVQDIVLPTLQRSSWNSHSESVLQTLLCSSEKDERYFAVQQILKIRGKNKLGDLRPRSRKNPELNIEATTLKDMINWKGSKEPVFTCRLTKQEINSFKETPMVVPYFCLHTQGIERAVKEVSSVYIVYELIVKFLNEIKCNNKPMHCLGDCRF